MWDASVSSGCVSEEGGKRKRYTIAHAMAFNQILAELQY